MTPPDPPKASPSPAPLRHHLCPAPPPYRSTHEQSHGERGEGRRKRVQEGAEDTSEGRGEEEGGTEEAEDRGRQ